MMDGQYSSAFTGPRPSMLSNDIQHAAQLYDRPPACSAACRINHCCRVPGHRWKQTDAAHAPAPQLRKHLHHDLAIGQAYLQMHYNIRQPLLREANVNHGPR